MKVYKTRTPEEEKEWLEFYTREGQNEALVKAVLPKIEAIIVPREVIEGIFTQAKPLFSSCVIVSNRRIFLHRPYPTGGAKIEEYAWQWCGGYDFYEDPVLSTFKFHFQPRNATRLSMQVDWLPRKQGKKLYQLANVADGYWYFENRNRWLQEERAKSGAVELHEAGIDVGSVGGVGFKGFVPSSQKDKEIKPEPVKEGPPTILPVSKPDSPDLKKEISDLSHVENSSELPASEYIFDSTNKTPAERLQHLKALLDEGVISPEEFKLKKVEILNSL